MTATTTLVRILSLAMLASATAIASPLWAESAAECQSMFLVADLNNDGFLSATEIASSDVIEGDLADTLADRDRVTLEEFVAECRD